MKKFEKYEKRGLPGGPNEVFTYTTGVFDSGSIIQNTYRAPSNIHGQGMFAGKAFKRGELIGLAHENGQPASELGRMHNHSENDATMVSNKVGNQRFVYAARDIQPGEELTTNYRLQPELEQPDDFMMPMAQYGGGQVFRNEEDFMLEQSTGRPVLPDEAMKENVNQRIYRENLERQRESERYTEESTKKWNEYKKNEEERERRRQIQEQIRMDREARELGFDNYMDYQAQVSLQNPIDALNRVYPTYNADGQFDGYTSTASEMSTPYIAPDIQLSKEEPNLFEQLFPFGGVEAIPVVGEAIDGAMFFDALEEGNYGDAFWHFAGLATPIVGGLALKKLFSRGAKQSGKATNNAIESEVRSLELANNPSIAKELAEPKPVKNDWTIEEILELPDDEVKKLTGSEKWYVEISAEKNLHRSILWRVNNVWTPTNAFVAKVDAARNKLTSYYRSSAYKQRLMNGLGISSSEADEIIESMVNKVNNTNINYNNYGTRFDKYGPAEGDAWAAADEVFIGEGVLEYDDLTIDDIIQHELGHSATEVITPSGKSINDQLPTLDFKEGFTYRTDYYGLPQEMRERGMSILRYLDNNNLSIDDFVKMDLSDLADAPYEIRQFKDVYEPTQQADYLKNIFSVAPIIGIGTVGAATLPDEIDTRQRGGALGTFGEYLPNKVLTMANAPEFFNNQAVYYRSDNPGPSEMRYNDIIREKVYAGTHGYNPATGQLVVLDKSVDVNPLDQLYNTLDRDEMPGSVSSGIASKDRKAYMDTLPADQREALEDEYKNMRKGYVSSSMSDMFENPLFYAPGLFGLAAGAGTLAAGAGSGLSSAMSAPLTIGSYVNPYITMSNILNAGFAADFLVNRAPTIPSLIQEGNYGEAALEGGFGALDVAGAYTLPIRAGSALGKLFRRGKSSIKPNKSFKSEIDWGKWNEEIPLNKELMQEYHAIEEVTKAKGTWMKNPDGSPFEGSPELFVQTQSNNFLKAFPDGYIPTYRGMTEKSFTEELISPRLKDSYTGVFTGNKDVAGWYGKPYYLAARKTDNSLNINAARREWTDIGIYANKADLEDAIERQKRLVETVKDMTNIQYTDGTLSAAQNRLNDLELILENWDDGNVQFNDLAAYINSDNVPLSYFGTDELAKYLEEVGLDNALVKNVYDGEFGDVLINNQVPGNYLKSLEGNNGMFDMTNPSMYKQTGGEERSIMMRPSQPITPEDVPLAHTFNLSSLQQRKAFNPFGGRAGAFNIPSGTLNPTMFGVYGDVAYNPEGIFGLGVSGDAVLNRELKPKDVQFLRSVGVNVPGPVGGSISPYVQFDGPMNTSIKGSMRFPVGGAGLPGTQGAPSFGLSLTKRFQDGGEETKDVFDIDQLKKGISYVESKDGLLMMNPESTATGLYGQLFSEFNKIPNLYSGTREEFAEDLDAQNRIFEMRVNDEIEGIPGLMKNAYELTEEYLPQLGDKFNFTLNEVAALSNFLGRQGARKYFGNVLRDGMSLEEVFPDLYSADANQSNKTPEKYIEEFRQALKEYGGEMELPKAQLGGFISKGIGLLRDAKKAYDEFDIEEFGRGLYEDMFNINEAYTPDYENNRDESEAKPFTKSNLNDFTYTQDEIDYINDVDNGYICTSGGCLKRAYTGWDNIVASRFSDVPGSWDIRRESGNLARNGNHPTNNRLFQVYNEDGTFRKYDTTTDSWDQHGVAVVNGGVNHFTLDQNKEKRFTDLSEAEQNAIYDKMTPGTIIGWGDDLGKYGVGFNTRGIGPDGKPLNLFSSRHSTIVIGKDVDGVPLIYDYDKVIRVTDPILNGTYNLSQLTNVTTPKSVSDLTYENLEERGLVNDEVDNLEVDVTKIYQDGLESQMKPFYTALKDNKVSLMNDLRLSNDDYNLIASGLLGLAMIESGGGTGFELEKTQQVNQIINRATLGFADNTLAPGDSVGLTQLNWDNIKNNPRLFNIAKRYGITSKNDLLNPTNSAIASVIFGSENLSAAKENYEMGLNPGIRDYKSTRGPSIFTPAELVKTIIREKQGKKLTFFDGKFRTEDGTVVNTQQTQTNYSPYGPVYSTYDRNIEDIQADLDDLYEPGNGIYYEAKKEDGEIVIYKYTLGNSELNDLEKFIYNWNSPNTLRKGDAQGESGYLNAVSKYINIDDFNVGGEVGTKPETYGLEDPSMLGLALYKDYIDGNNESEAARKNYDTFNARYYKQAKQNNTTAPDYIMSEVFKLGGSV